MSTTIVGSALVVPRRNPARAEQHASAVRAEELDRALSRRRMHDDSRRAETCDLLHTLAQDLADQLARTLARARDLARLHGEAHARGLDEALAQALARVRTRTPGRDGPPPVLDLELDLARARQAVHDLGQAGEIGFALDVALAETRARARALVLARDLDAGRDRALLDDRARALKSALAAIPAHTPRFVSPGTDAAPAAVEQA